MIQSFPAALIGIIKDRRSPTCRLMPQRHHVVAKARETIALGAQHRLFGFGIVFGETHTHGANQGNIKAIKPDHRLSALVNGKVAVIMPSPRSEERRVGKECVSTGRYGWAP